MATVSMYDIKKIKYIVEVYRKLPNVIKSYKSPFEISYEFYNDNSISIIVESLDIQIYDIDEFLKIQSIADSVLIMNHAGKTILNIKFNSIINNMGETNIE